MGGGGGHKQSDIPVILPCHSPCSHSHSLHHHHHHTSHHHHPCHLHFHRNHHHRHRPSVFHSNAKGVGENIVTASISCNELEKKIDEIFEKLTWKIDEIAELTDLEKFILQ